MKMIFLMTWLIVFNLNSFAFSQTLKDEKFQISQNDKILLDCPSENSIGYIRHFKILENSDGQIYQSVHVAGYVEEKVKLLKRDQIGKSFSLKFRTKKYNAPMSAYWKFVNNEFEIIVYDETIPPRQIFEESIVYCKGPLKEKWLSQK